MNNLLIEHIRLSISILLETLYEHNHDPNKMISIERELCEHYDNYYELVKCHSVLINMIFSNGI